MERSLLLVAPGWVGDAVMAHALVRRLKDDLPDARLTVLGAPFMEGLALRMPGVDAFIASPFGHGDFGFLARRRFGRSLAGRFDHAYILPNSWKSALIPWFAGIPRRTGFVGESRWLLLNDARRLDRQGLPRMVDRFALLAEPSGRAQPRPLLSPRLEVAFAQRMAALERFGLSIDRPVAALCVGAEFGPAKRWPAANAAALAEQLHATGWAVWLIGSAKDAPLADAIETQAPAVVNLCGRTQLADAVDLLASASVIVSNDSGLMHVAAALERPLIALYGSSSPVFTPPLSAQARVVRLDLPCSPCFRRECPLGHLDCLNRLDAGRVHAEINALTGRTAPSLSQL